MFLIILIILIYEQQDLIILLSKHTHIFDLGLNTSTFLLQGVLIEFIGPRARVLIEYKDEKLYNTVDANALVAIPEVCHVCILPHSTYIHTSIHSVSLAFFAYIIEHNTCEYTVM